MLTREMTRQALYVELGNAKSSNIDLQIKIEEQRQQIVKLQQDLRKSKTKIKFYREITNLIN